MSAPERPSAEKVRVVTEVLESQISFAYQGSAQRLARQIVDALRLIDGPDSISGSPQ